MPCQLPRTLTERIICAENILTGKPVIKGTRLAVEFIVGLLGHGWTETEVLENYPHIVQADIRACLRTQVRCYIKKRDLAMLRR